MSNLSSNLDTADKPKRIFQRLLGFIQPYQGWFVVALVLTLLLAALTPLTPLIVQHLLDNEVANGDLQGLQRGVGLLLGLIAVRAVVMYGQTWLTGWLGQTIMNDLRLAVFNHITRLNLRFFDRTPVGQLQTRTISDIETLNNVFSSGLVQILGQLLQVFAIFGIMFYTSWRLTLVVLISLPLLILATWVFKVKVKAAFQRVRKYVSELNSFLQEHIMGMTITQLFNREQEEYQRFGVVNEKQKKANIDTVLYYSIFFPVVELISAIALGLLVWYGSGQVLAGQVTFGVLVAFLMYIQMFFRPIRMLADQFNTLQLGLVSGERLFRILDNTQIIAEPQQPAALSLSPQHPPAIEFRELEFAYNPEEPVLRKISFRVEPGTSTALVGATGSGKTSIISVLMRFYEYQRGEVLLDGVPLRDIPQRVLREGMGLVQQDVYLYSATIVENVTLFNSAIGEERVRQAAQEIGADEFIESLPGGYQFNVGERGGRLSAGQRQLLALMRVLVYDPAILLLDESTANIDSESERLIQQALNRVLRRRTSLVVAHRLSTIQGANQILVLHQGQIIERGNHQELLQLNGRYRQLHDLQHQKSALIT